MRRAAPRLSFLIVLLLFSYCAKHAGPTPETPTTQIGPNLPEPTVLALPSPTPTIPPESGSLDTGFGTSGFVTTQFSNTISPQNQDYGYRNVIQPDGKIVVSGQAYRAGSPNSWDFALSRYLTDGRLDTSFGTNGKVGTDFGNAEYGRTLALQADGKIVVGGWAKRGSNNQFALARYLQNGALDTTFGTAGSVFTSFASNATQMATVIQSDGGILSGGYTTDAGAIKFVLVRYTASGTLDATFGTAGTVFTTINGPSYLTALTLQPDNKILAAGYANGVGGRDFAIARYLTNGTLDSTFGTAGKRTLDLNTKDDYAYDLALQTDGKILLSGVAGVGTAADFAIARLLPNGSTDTAFGTLGKTLTDFGTLSDVATAVAVQTDGKIVQTGYHGNVLLARYLPSGILDPSFGSSGKVDSGFGSGLEQAWGVSLRDGKILVSGYDYNGSDYDFLLARFHQ